MTKRGGAKASLWPSKRSYDTGVPDEASSTHITPSGLFLKSPPSIASITGLIPETEMFAMAACDRLGIRPIRNRVSHRLRRARAARIVLKSTCHTGADADGAPDWKTAHSRDSPKASSPING